MYRAMLTVERWSVDDGPRTRGGTAGFFSSCTHTHTHRHNSYIAHTYVCIMYSETSEKGNVRINPDRHTPKGNKP